MLTLLIVAPLIMLVAGVAGRVLARAKRRNDGWGWACFAFPPLFLALMAMPRGRSDPSRPYDDKHHNPAGQPY